MDVKTALRKLLPGLGLRPRAFAVQLAWLFPSSLLLCYLALMPVVILPDVSLTAYTTLYITAAGLATPAMLATIASAWLLYTYLHSVTVSIVRPMERGRSLAHLATNVAGARLLHVLIRLAHAWVHLLGVFSREPRLFLKVASLLSLIRQEIPVHLATGWHPGTHPHVLYL